MTPQTFQLSLTDQWTWTHMHMHTHTHCWVDLSPAEYCMASVTSDLRNVTFPRGPRKFIKRHNEHYNRHQSLMLALSQDRKSQNKYVGQIKTPTPCQLPAETSFSKYIIISYYSRQLTPSLNLTRLPCCFTSSIHLYLHFLFAVLTLVMDGSTHTAGTVSHRSLILHQRYDGAARGYNALLWLEWSCWSGNKVLRV